MKKIKRSNSMKYIGLKDVVLASENTLFSKYECDNCKKLIVSNSDFAPFCPYCDGVMSSKGNQKYIKKEDTILEIKCNECNSLIEFEASSDMKNINCIVCGSKLNLESSNIDVYLGKQEDQKEEEKEDNSQKENQNSDDNNSSLVNDVQDEVTLFSTMGVENIENNKITFVSNNSILFIIYDKTPIAYIEYDLIPSDKAKATFKNKMDVFINSFRMAISELGLEVALKEFGGQFIKIKIKVNEDTNKKIEESKASFESKYQEDINKFKEDFLQSVSIAIVGMNKNFFKNTDNALKKVFWEELKNVGIDNPELIIENAFATASEDYFQKVISKAMELIEKPLEVRNELAKAIVDSNYITKASSNIQQNGNVSYKSRLMAGNIGISTSVFSDNFINKASLITKKEKFKTMFNY